MENNFIMSNISYVCRQKGKIAINLWPIILLILGIGLLIFSHIAQIVYPGLIIQTYIIIIQIVSAVILIAGILWYIMKPKQCN